MSVTRRNDRSTMTLDEYQGKTTELAVYPGRGENQLIYPAVSMAGEAGEVAKAVLAIMEAQPDHRRLNMGVASLEVAAACGLLLEQVKKMYRNDPPGELTTERKQLLLVAIEKIRAVLETFVIVIRTCNRIEFPPLPTSEASQDNLVKEAGDVLWYVSAFCTEMRISLGRVAEINYEKLTDRARRDVLRSSGDDR